MFGNGPTGEITEIGTDSPLVVGNRHLKVLRLSVSSRIELYILLGLSSLAFSCGSEVSAGDNSAAAQEQTDNEIGEADNVGAENTNANRKATGSNEPGIVTIDLSLNDGSRAVSTYGNNDSPVNETSDQTAGPGGDPNNLASNCKDDNQRAKLRNAVAAFEVNVINQERTQNAIVRGRMNVRGVGVIEWSVVETREDGLFIAKIQMFIAEYDDGAGKLAIGDTVVNPTPGNMGTIDLKFRGKKNSHKGLFVNLGGAFGGDYSVEEVMEFLKIIDDNSDGTY